MVSMPVLTSAKKCKTENRRRFEMSWEKNSSFLVLSFVTTESISLQKKNPPTKQLTLPKTRTHKRRWNETSLYNLLKIPSLTTKLIFEATFCVCALLILSVPLLPPKMAFFFSTRISRKLESYYYNVKNLESYGNIPKLHLRQQRCVRCT